MSGIVISGIQQVGIGVSNLQEAWKWYRDKFGVDIRVFEEKAEAGLMINYTGGEKRSRHAAMALNLQGGGGFEIWQYTDRTPVAPEFELQLGDLGIFAVKIKSKDVEATYEKFKSSDVELLGGLETDPRGEKHFYLKDPFGNIFEVLSGKNWFRDEKKLTGAAYGVVVGTSKMDMAIKFYSRILGYDKVVYDETGNFNDLNGLPGGGDKLRRVLLFHTKERVGGFSKMFGASYLELIETRERKPEKIFGGRLWGDLGFIHLCYDINGMQNLRKLCSNEGFPFTVDSHRDHDENGFDMGEASGHFSYVEDPDGTLIEFVEAHRLPIIQKLGLYLNLKNRNPEKALPNWLLKAMRFNRVKS